MRKIMSALSLPAQALAVLALVVAGGFLLGACGSSGGTHTPTRAPASATASATPVAIPTEGLDISEAAIDKTWSDYSSDQRDAVCAEVDGTDPAVIAEQLSEGSGGATLVDWNEVAMWLVTECSIEQR
jgi:hypothetical protein